MNSTAHNTVSPHGKLALRADMRDRRQALEPEERRKRALAAATHLLASHPWKKARTVALYVAVRGEMDTGPLLQAAWQGGKLVLLPLCSAMGGAAEMRFIPCEGIETLAPGAFGIPEPPCPAGTPPMDAEPDLVVVPGVAFDKNGTRLGHGGGFYDRYFARPETTGALRIGYAYDFQVVDSLARDPWDLPVDVICTEQGLLWTIKR